MRIRLIELERQVANLRLLHKLQHDTITVQAGTIKRMNDTIIRLVGGGSRS